MNVLNGHKYTKKYPEIIFARILWEGRRLFKNKLNSYSKHEPITDTGFS